MRWLGWYICNELRKERKASATRSDGTLQWFEWMLLKCGTWFAHTLIGYRFHVGSVLLALLRSLQQSGEKIVHPPAPAAAASYPSIIWLGGYCHFCEFTPPGQTFLK